MYQSVREFSQIMRRDAGRNSDRDAGRSVQKKLGNFTGKEFWLLFRAVVIRLPVNSFLFYVGQQFLAHLRQPAFRVSHRRRVITVYGTEVSLSMDKGIAQGKILSHSDKRFID